jgi:putative DNA primase/helicase
MTQDLEYLDPNGVLLAFGDEALRNHFDDACRRARLPTDGIEFVVDYVKGKSNGHAPNGASQRLKPIDITDLLAMTFPPRAMVLAPIIPEKGLVMIYASRGIGKTHVALGISYAVATGGKFLRWEAPKPRRVLHVDGEMPAQALQDRWSWIAGASKDAQGMLQIIPGDLIECGVGNLSSPEVQAELEEQLEGIDLLVLDNLSSLTAVIRDNDAESWGPIQDWLLKLRRRGISVLIVHHAGKGGQQRGTSRREDVLDTSLSLCRPNDYQPEEGARFEVHFEKARGIIGSDAKAFEARLEVRDGQADWTLKELEDVEHDRVKELLALGGMTVREIAEETGIPKSTVHNIKKKLEKLSQSVSQGDQPVDRYWDK